MKRVSLTIALMLAAGSAYAASPRSQNPPTVTSLCLDVGGGILPVTCTAPGSRLDQREDICLCLRGGLLVDVPVCQPGERPPAESRAYENARRDAARDGTLIGDTYEGQRMCVRPRLDRRG
jgi:hypothetical protein